MNDDTLNAILRRIICEPDENLHPLVYADRLEELNELDRAEFVRVQTELLTLRDVDKPIIGGPIFAEEFDEAGDYFRAWERKKVLLKREKELMYVLWCGVRRDIGNGYSIAHTAGYCPPDEYLCKLFGPKTMGELATVRFVRGMVREVIMSAEDFLRHADALIWHPDQRVTCPRCVGRSPILNDEMRRYGGHLCVECGTHHPPGFISRPCPPTAQPIRKVILTSWEGHPEVLEDHYLQDRWPGVEFELPQ